MSQQSNPRALSVERRPLYVLPFILGTWFFLLLVPYLLFSLHAPLLLWAPAFIFMGVQQHALSLWMHEGSHWLLFANQRLNDSFSNLLLANPVCVSLEAYRYRHFTHHEHLGIQRDTKRVIFTAVRGKAFVVFCIEACLGVAFFRMAGCYIQAILTAHRAANFRTAEPTSTTPTAMGSRILTRARTHPTVEASEGHAREDAGSTDVGVATNGRLEGWREQLGPWLSIATVQLGIFTLFSIWTHWTYYLLLWMLPFMTVFQLVAGLRALAEHHPPAGAEHPYTRALRPTWLDRILFCRAGFEYHWLHHQYPNIPCFNLRYMEEEAGDPANRPAAGYLATLCALVKA